VSTKYTGQLDQGENDAAFVWTLSAMMSQNKNGSDSRGTLYRVVLREMAFSYVNVYILQQLGRWGIHTYKINARGFASISKLRSGFPWLDYFVSHHANQPLIPSWFHIVETAKKF